MPLGSRTRRARGHETHNDRLRRGRVAADRGRVERHERIGFGIVGRRRAAWRVISHEAEIWGNPVHVVVFPAGNEVDEIAVGEAESGDVVGMDEHDASAVLDAAVAVAVPIDRRVELIVAPKSLQQQMTLWDLERLNGRSDEFTETRFGGEGSRIAWRMRKDKPTRAIDLGVVVGEAWHDA